MTPYMRIALILLALLLAAPSVAEAASIAYVENGEVWVSSLDGARKARLAGPVVNGNGATEKWLAVAASDGGRIVAARNVPGRMSQFSWFKVWEPNGTSTVEGPLNAPTGWTVYVYPLGFDVTADGQHMVYGYSNSSGCCPINFGRGFYVRPVTNSVLDPIIVSGPEEPTADPCELTSPPVVIAPAGKSASIGGADVTATGSATPKASGKVTIKLKLNSVGRKKVKRLKGARLTLKITQAGRTTTKIVKLG
jgi:hypothetical protein